jgi:hypothetical protein
MPAVEDVPRVMPHRYPFLFVDRVVEFDPGARSVEARAGGGFLLLARTEGGGENVVYVASLDAVR